MRWELGFIWHRANHKHRHLTHRYSVSLSTTDSFHTGEILPLHKETASILIFLSVVFSPLCKPLSFFLLSYKNDYLILIKISLSFS